MNVHANQIYLEYMYETQYAALRYMYTCDDKYAHSTHQIVRTHNNMEDFCIFQMRLSCIFVLKHDVERARVIDIYIYVCIYIRTYIYVAKTGS